VITQDAADLLGSDLGQAVIANAATQILMRQAPQAIDLIADTFALTGGEARMLLAAGRGEALLLAGSHRWRFRPWPPRMSTNLPQQAQSSPEVTINTDATLGWFGTRTACPIP
jgi:hypothetical protein